ncbi:MAG: hypothetical protein P8175_17390 [Deltaproteobacteria bacterium]
MHQNRSSRGPGHAVIQRLNDAFDGNRPFAILKQEILEQQDEVLVLA